MAFDILIVDDEKDICDLVSGILEDEGYITRTASCYIEAIEAVRRARPNLVILDVWLGEGDRDGLRLIDVIRAELDELIPIIMMSGHGTIETAVSAIKKGAYDFIEKPFDSNRLLLSVSKAIETFKLRAENEELKVKARVGSAVIGESASANSMRRDIEKSAKASGICFISGPIGSDKEEVAREVHKLSSRKDFPFLVVNCNVQNQKKLEVELFGSEINCSGNIVTKTGILERAVGGTVYFDEITTLSQLLQSKLLKVLEDNEYSRVGSSSKTKMRTCIIGSASLDVSVLIKNNLFSSELYHRLIQNTIAVHPLSSRQDDIPSLISHFMERSCKAHNVHNRKFSDEAMAMLTAYSWPGDVMQLKNFIDWALVMSLAACDDSVITVDKLPKEITDGKSYSGCSDTKFASFVAGLSIKEAREAFEREYFTEQLRKFSGNISQTSKFVGMERSALHRKLRSLNITDSKLIASGE